MERQYVRITSLIEGELNVIRISQYALENYVNANCGREDEDEVLDWLQDVSVGDDISVYRYNNKALVIVRVQ